MHGSFFRPNILCCCVPCHYTCTKIETNKTKHTNVMWEYEAHTMFTFGTETSGDPLARGTLHVT